MPLLKVLGGHERGQRFLRGNTPVLDWLEQHPDEVGISTFTLAEIRRGIELKREGKARRELERDFRFILEDYKGAIFVFDEADQEHPTFSWVSNPSFWQWRR